MKKSLLASPILVPLPSLAASERKPPVPFAGLPDLIHDELAPVREFVSKGDL